MSRKTGISSQTAQRMVMDAGAVYIDYGETSERLFGATREGSTFEVSQEVREIDVDGLRGPTKGFRRVVEEHVRLTVNLLEMTAENVQTALVGAQVDANGNGGQTVTRSLKLSDVAYLENVALVADYSGSSDPVVIKLKNAIVDGDFSLQAQDREESTVELQFTGHFDPENLDESPFEIIFPDTGSGE